MKRVDHPPGMVEVGDALDDFEIMMADLRRDLERNLDAIEMSDDERATALREIDAATEKVRAHFEEKIAEKLTLRRNQ